MAIAVPLRRDTLKTIINTHRYFKRTERYFQLLMRSDPWQLKTTQSFSCRGQEMFSDSSIRTRITALSVVSMVALISTISAINYYQNNNTGRQISAQSQKSIESVVENQLASIAREQSTSIQKIFSEKYSMLGQLASQMTIATDLSKQSTTYVNLARSGASQAVRAAFLNDTSLLGAWSILEPNEIGEDKDFINDVSHGSNDVGRFATYWNRIGSPGENIPTKEYKLRDETKGESGLPFNFFYNCSLKRDAACLVPPFSLNIEGNKILMTTLSVPVRRNGTVIGVAGVDIGLEAIQKIAEQAKSKIYDGLGEISITSDSGVIAADTATRDMIGKNLVINSGASDHSDAEIVIKQPISIGVGDPWWITLKLPKSVTQSEVDKLRAMQIELQNESLINSIIVAIIAAIIGATLMWITATRITIPIHTVSNMLKEIADGDGDLSQRLKYAQKNELGNVAKWFNVFLDKLQPTIHSIRVGISDTKSTADQTFSIAEETSNGIQAQFKDIDQVAAASNEMAATAHEVASNAAFVAQAAKDAETSAKEGHNLINRTNADLLSLTEQLTCSLDDSRLLSDSSAQISDVLDVIRAIAQQTNLLALNAAIEAARAGESGRGFAVVADEVRSLAMRTQDSVEQIRIVIEKLQSGANTVTSAMQSSQARASSSSILMQETVQSFTDITQAVSKILDMTNQIATASEEQSAVAEDINFNITSIRTITQELNEKAESSAEMSKLLSTLADQQHSLAKQFRT